jgi:hypothetical protein
MRPCAGNFIRVKSGVERASSYTAFAGHRRIAAGPLPLLLEQTRAWLRDHPDDPHALILFFEDHTGRQVDFDLRERPMSEPRPGPGRPKLGVVAREVTLLPRHWEWLEAQPQGASAALRRLVDEARKLDGGWRVARDAAYRFLSAMGGDLPGFEEARRALSQGDRPTFEQRIQDWPADIRAHVQRLAGPAFSR